MYWAGHIGRERASWPRSRQDDQIWRIIDLARVPISKTRMEFQIRLGKPVLLKIAGSGWSNTGSLKDNSSARGIGMIFILFVVHGRPWDVIQLAFNALLVLGIARTQYLVHLPLSPRDR